MIKVILDWSAVLTGAGVFIKVLPAIVGVWTIAWLSISMWETKTVQAWLKRDKKSQVDKVDPEVALPHVEDDD